MILRRRIGKER